LLIDKNGIRYPLYLKLLTSRFDLEVNPHGVPNKNLVSASDVLQKWKDDIVFDTPPGPENAFGVSLFLRRVFLPIIYFTVALQELIGTVTLRRWNPTRSIEIRFPISNILPELPGPMPVIKFFGCNGL
jgi:hypothetical protein